MNVPDRIITQFLANSVSFEVILVEGGTFNRGGADDEALYREKPVHPIKLSPFYLGKYVVTQEVWKTVMGKNPARFQGNRRPVEQVSWDDTQDFIGKLNSFANREYRLPTEAEWEFAARGGNARLTDGYVYAGSDKLKEVGWYRENSGRETQEVGLKYPNELGLYDMSGNVFEWCQDWHQSNYYKKCKSKGVVENPLGPETGKSRVIRGGSWLFFPQRCRVAYRTYSPPEYRSGYLGFRLALSLQSVG